MADGYEPVRRATALAHIRAVRARLTPEQRVEMLDQLMLLLIDQLSVTEVEVAIDGAVKMAKRRHPVAVGAKAPRPRFVDRQGDVWTVGDDGLLHTAETAPVPREHVEKKWGPLREVAHA